MAESLIEQVARLLSNGEELGPDDPDRLRVFPTFERALDACTLEELLDPTWADAVNARANAGMPANIGESASEI